jgi:hypothetical protein
MWAVAPERWRWRWRAAWVVWVASRELTQGPSRSPVPAQKASRRHLPLKVHIGGIEQLACPDEAFDVVLSTLMMHHLPAPR